jgi:predicted transposase YdaD
MPIQIDIRKTLFYKWGEKEGEKRGEKRGILKGLKEGLKEGILGIARAKFGGQKAKQFKNFLEKIDDINHLKKIKTESVRAKTWEDFIKFFQNSKISNPKNSKKNRN